MGKPKAQQIKVLYPKVVTHSFIKLLISACQLMNLMWLFSLSSLV